MKYFLFLVIHFVILVNLTAQKVKTNGEIQIGQSLNPSEAGAIRWSGTDFEGFNGTEWISLTDLGSNNNGNSNTNSENQSFWGQPVISSYEDHSFYAPDANHWDHFGLSIDIDNQYAVISGYHSDINYINSGRAYVFENVDNDWEYRATLLPSDSGAWQFFGYKVAISGSTIAVSASNDQSNKGAVYVYDMPSGGWVDTTENAKLIASDGLASDELGWSLAIENNTIVAGARSDDINFTGQGSVYVFTKSIGGWVDTTETAKLIASDPYFHDSFGYSVDISNGTIVVGSPNDDVTVANQGSLYIFEKPLTGWVDTTENAKINAEMPIANTHLGSSIAVDSNVIVTGTLFGETVHVFVKDSSGWENTVETAKIVSVDGVNNDNFGFSVEVEDSVIVIGCPNQDSGSGVTGSIYIIETDNGKWDDKLGTVQLLGYNMAQGSDLGHDVAIEGNMILGGAPEASGAGGTTGKVLVYRRK